MIRRFNDRSHLFQLVEPAFHQTVTVMANFSATDCQKMYTEYRISRLMLVSKLKLLYLPGKEFYF